MSAIKTLQELLLSYSPFFVAVQADVAGVPVCKFLNQQLRRYIKSFTCMQST